jgi:hypothetical protein
VNVNINERVCRPSSDNGSNSASSIIDNEFDIALYIYLPFAPTKDL